MKIAYAGLAENPDREFFLLRSVFAPEPGDKSVFWLPAGKRGASGIAAREAALEWLAARWTEERPDILVFPAGAAGHELAVRLSARLGCACFPELRKLRRENTRLVGRKKVCGSNMDWEMTLEPPAILTVVPRGPLGTELAEKAALNAEIRPEKGALFPRWLLSSEILEPGRVNPLESAPLIFAAGRGLGSAAACERFRSLAARYGAPLGFSRPTALNGWGKTGDIIGQSGIRTQAAACVALGVSGAAAFMAGIENVEYLIAVNTDKDAPVFRYADAGIIAAAEEFMNALEGMAP